MAIKQPHEYSKRILLVVSGSTPQVITETLWALIKQDTPFIPTELKVITTTDGKDIINKKLLLSGIFKNFCEEYNLNLKFDESDIVVIKKDGQLLDDIRTKEDNEGATNSILNFIRQHTLDNDSAVHVSLAGGRKTMSFLMGYAVSLFGRIQDRLSHVLINPLFEKPLKLNNEPYTFFYPPKQPIDLQFIDGSTGNTDRDIGLTLADIPFVRLSLGLPSNLTENKNESDINFSDLINSVQALVENEPYLEINIKEKSVKVGRGKSTSIKFAKKPFSWLTWFAYQTKTQANFELICDKDSKLPNKDFLKFMLEHKLYKSDLDGNYGKLQDAVSPAIYQAFITDSNFNVNKILRKALGKYPSEPYLIESVDYGKGIFKMKLTPDQINIIE